MLHAKRSYHDAEQRLAGAAGGRALAEILEMVRLLPMPLYQGKSKNYPQRDILQTIINPFARKIWTEQYGWHAEVRLLGGKATDIVDFYKDFTPDCRVWIEVEFGNMSRVDSDIKKLAKASKYDLLDVGVIVVPAQCTFGRVDGGVAGFNRVKDEMDEGLYYPFPCLVLGLEAEEHPQIEVSDWGYPLEPLKGKGQTPEKEAVIDRLWHKYVRPGLGPDSVFHRCGASRHAPPQGAPEFHRTLAQVQASAARPSWVSATAC